MSVDVLLNKLNGIKKTGANRWLCKCPAHDDRSPSLSISLDERNGNILMRCFAECDPYSILQAVGLDWDAVFPEKHEGDYKPKKNLIYASEAMQIIRFESQVVLASVYATRRGDITQSDLERLELAMKRINNAYESAGL